MDRQECLSYLLRSLRTYSILSASAGYARDAPLVLVAFQLFASCGPGIVGQRENFPVYAGEQRIVQRIQFLLRGLLDFETILIHAGAYVSGG